MNQDESGRLKTIQDESGRIKTNLDESGRIQTSSDLSEVEQTGLIGLLQLLQSVYKQNIWEVLAVIVFQDKPFGKLERDKTLKREKGT